MLVPSAGSGIPGSPLSTDVPQRPGLERHVPVLFLDLNGKRHAKGRGRVVEWILVWTVWRVVFSDELMMEGAALVK